MPSERSFTPTPWGGETRSRSGTSRYTASSLCGTTPTASTGIPSWGSKHGQRICHTLSVNCPHVDSLAAGRVNTHFIIIIYLLQTGRWREHCFMIPTNHIQVYLCTPDSEGVSRGIGEAVDHGRPSPQLPIAILHRDYHQYATRITIRMDCLALPYERTGAHLAIAGNQLLPQCFKPLFILRRVLHLDVSCIRCRAPPPAHSVPPGYTEAGEPPPPEA